MKKIRGVIRSTFLKSRVFFLTNIIIILLGIIIVFLSSLFDENLKTIFLSIGTSVIASGIVSFLELLREEQMDEKEKTNLKIIEEGGIENIFKRRDLEEYKEIVYNAKKSIDITGYSLRGFYESNKDIILEKCEKYKNFLVRIILVNPSSQFSENRDMEENEDDSRLFKDMYSTLKKWSQKSERIKIRLIDEPLSDMVYRIDDVMYTGPYFYKQSSKETYTNKLKKTGWLFEAYQRNFDRMWEEATEIKYEKNC